MKTISASWLTISLFGLLLTACERATNLERDLQNIAQQINRSAGGEGSKGPNREGLERDDDDDTQMSLQTAVSIVRADAIVNKLSGTRTASSYQASEFTKLLIKRAKSVVHSAAGVPPLQVTDFETLTDTERATIQKQAEATLLEYTRAFEAAASDHAIERLGRTTAQLETLAEDLRKVASDNSLIPGEALALIPLPPPPVLEKAITDLEIKQRVLREELLATGDPQTELHLKFISKEIQHMKAVRDSPERRRFSTERKNMFKKISDERWADLSNTRAARTELKLESVRRELGVDTGYLEIKLNANAVRGPPEPVADMVFASLREYDLDPGGWTRNEARLRALASEIAQRPEVPAILKQPPATETDLIASLLSNERIEYLRSVVGTIYGDTKGDTPTGYLFADKALHHKEWKDALDREVQRRAEESYPRRIFEQPEVSRLVTQYTSLSGVRTERAEAELLQAVSYRFPNLDAVPTGLRNDVAQIQKDAVTDSMGRALDVLDKYRDVSSKLAQSTSAAPEELMKFYHESKGSIQELVYHLDRAITQAERLWADVTELRAKQRRLIALLPDDPNWTPPPPDSSTAEPKLRRYQPALERAIQNVESLVSRTEGLDIKPIKFAQENGRLTVGETDLLRGTKALAKIDRDATKPRLTTDWLGRLDKNGLPYSFEEVKFPKHFDAIGGGIHLGETATMVGNENLRSALLTYDADVGLVLRDPKAGRQWTVAGKEIDPTTLKALYRFSIAGRNAAVSIGWGSQRETLSDVWNRKGESRVLLDPFLVDTAVGQDLVLADLVPWRLDKPTLPNGQPIAFHDQFKKLQKSFSEPALEQAKVFTAGVQPYKEEDRLTWIDKLKNAKVPPMIEALWNSTNMDEGFSSYLSSEKLALFSELKKSYRSQIQNDWKVTLRWSKLSFQEQESRLDSAVNSAIEKRSKPIEEDCRKSWKLLPMDIKKARQLGLESLLVETMSQPDSSNRAAVELWTSIQKASNKSDDAISRTLLAFSNPVTLATLLDDKVSFSLAPEGKVSFTAALRYFYGTSFFDITDNHVGAGHAPDDETMDVKPLPELASLVNANIAALIKGYPVLQRIKQYAELAAFFRWATKAEVAGQLGLIDLGSLGAFPANDRAHFPTVDSLKRD